MRISDWSSDVCSSDLIRAFIIELSEQAAEIRHHVENLELVDIAFLTKLDDMVDQEGRAVLDSRRDPAQPAFQFGSVNARAFDWHVQALDRDRRVLFARPDRKSTRLNSSH